MRRQARGSFPLAASPAVFLTFLLGSWACRRNECSRSQCLWHLLLSLITVSHWVSSSRGLLTPLLPHSLFSQTLALLRLFLLNSLSHCSLTSQGSYTEPVWPGMEGEAGCLKHRTIILQERTLGPERAGTSPRSHSQSRINLDLKAPDCQPPPFHFATYLCNSSHLCTDTISYHPSSKFNL